MVSPVSLSGAVPDTRILQRQCRKQPEQARLALQNGRAGWLVAAPRPQPNGHLPCSARSDTHKAQAAGVASRQDLQYLCVPATCPWPRFSPGESVTWHQHTHRAQPSTLLDKVKSFFSSSVNHGDLPQEIRQLDGTFTDGETTESAHGLAAWWRYQGFR